MRFLHSSLPSGAFIFTALQHYELLVCLYLYTDLWIQCIKSSNLTFKAYEYFINLLALINLFLPKYTQKYASKIWRVFLEVASRKVCIDFYRMDALYGLSYFSFSLISKVTWKVCLLLESRLHFHPSDAGYQILGLWEPETEV